MQLSVGQDGILVPPLPREQLCIAEAVWQYSSSSNHSAACSRWRRLNPRFADAWFNRGTYWGAKGDWARAEADFTRTIELSPQLADAHALRGLVRLRQNRAQEAQEDFNQCLKLNPVARQSLERMIEETKQRIEQEVRRGSFPD